MSIATRREHLVIAFQTGRRVRDVHVAVANLPARPRFQLRGRVDVELGAVIAEVADVGVQRKPFGESRSPADLRIQLFPHYRFPALSRNGWLSRGNCRGRRRGIRSNQIVRRKVFLVEAASPKTSEVVFGLLMA